MPNKLTQFREAHPEFADLDDRQLLTDLHSARYSDVPFAQFAERMTVERSPLVAAVKAARAVPEMFSARGAALAESSVQDDVEFSNRMSEIRTELSGQLKTGEIDYDTYTASVEAARDRVFKEVEQNRLALRQESADKREAFQSELPQTMPGTSASVASSAVTSVAAMAPAVAATMITKNPTLGAAIFSAPVYGEQYSESIEKGRSEDEAVMDGIVMASSELVTERIPLGMLLKTGKGAVGRVVRASAAEGAQEGVTQVIQRAYERGIIDDEMSIQEAVGQILVDPRERAMLQDAMVTGGLVGGTIQGSKESAEAMIRQYLKDSGQDPNVDFDSPEPDQPDGSIEGTVETREERAARELRERGIERDGQMPSEAVFVDPLNRRIESEEAADAVPTLPALAPEGAPSQDAMFSMEEAAPNLYVAHNLSAENLRHAESLGGIPAPSLAVGSADGDALTGYGEISLIADKDLIDPKKDKSMRTYSGDAYTSRYPDVEYSVKQKELDEALEPFMADITATQGLGMSPDLSDIKSRGLEEILRSDGIKRYWLREEKGVDLEDNSDRRENMMAVREAMYTPDGSLQDQFSEWAEKQFAPLVSNSRLYTQSESGRRRYYDHTLDNVVKIMNRGSVGAETGFAGSGRVRAMGSRRFKSIEEMQDARGNIVDDKEMEQARDEMQNKLHELMESLKPYYRYSTSNAFMYMDAAAENVGDFMVKGQSGLIDFKPLPENLINDLKDFGDYLRDMPTEYFETKARRAVDVSEFRAAVVPENASQETVDYLESKGLEVRRYDSNSKQSRLDAIKSFEDVMFSSANSSSAQDKGPEWTQTVEAMVADVIEGMELPPSLQPRVVASREELPVSIRSGVDDTVQGAFFPHPTDPVIYIIANKMGNARDVATVVMHEIVGHYGLRRVLGNEYNDFMDRVLSSFPDRAKAAAKRNGIPFGVHADMDRRAAEESIAYMAEKVLLGEKLSASDQSLLDRVVAFFKRMFEKLMNRKRTGVTDKEILEMIHRARDYVNSPSGMAEDFKVGSRRNEIPPSVYSNVWSFLAGVGVPEYAPVSEYDLILSEAIINGELSNNDVSSLFFGSESVSTLTELVGAQDASNFVSKDKILDAIRNRANELKEMELPDSFPLFSREEIIKEMQRGETEAFVFTDKSAMFNNFLFNAQDKFVDLKSANKQMYGDKVPDRVNAYLRENIMHGRVQSRLEDFEADYMDPLLDKIKQSSWSWEDVEMYLYARHAEEANAHLRSINEDPKYDSGMSDAEAQGIMGAFSQSDALPEMESIAADVDQIIEMTRNMLVDQGLLEKETVDTWRQTYDYYVPLKGFDQETANSRDGAMGIFSGSGRGFDQRVNVFKRRLGRADSKAGNILANVVAQYQQTVVRSEKARVGRSLLEFVKENPNSAIKIAEDVEYERRYNERTGLVEVAPKSRFPLPENLVRVPVDGKEVLLEFEIGNPVAERALSGMKNMTASQLNAVLGFMLGINSYFSMIYTQLDPQFFIPNFARDLQTAFLTMSADDINKAKYRVVRQTPAAVRGIMGATMNAKGTAVKNAVFGKPDTEWGQWYERFRKAGGQTGWSQTFQDVKQLEDKLRSKISGDRMVRAYNAIITARDYISDLNSAVENGVRLSAFKEAVEMGMSEDQAALLAKDLTVNFNRKGAHALTGNSLYLFFNASVQGIANVAKTARSKRGQKYLMAFTVMGMMSSILARLIGGEDDDGQHIYDKIPWSTKERNFVIVLPEELRKGEGFDDSYIALPMPYGYNVFAGAGQKLGDYFYDGVFGDRIAAPLQAGRGQVTQDVIDLSFSFMNSFNPIGTESSIAQTLMPTIGDPFVQVGENLAWHGGPLMPETNPFDSAVVPDSERFFKSTSKGYVIAAQAINEITGGSRFEPGMLDFSPETLELMLKTYTGGVGTTIGQTVDVTLNALTGGDQETNNIPFVRKFLKSTGDRNIRDVYFSRKARFATAQNILKAQDEVPLDREGDYDSLVSLIESGYKIESQLMSDFESTDKRIRNYNRRLRAAYIADNDEDVEYYTNEMLDEMHRFNGLYNELVKEASGGSINTDTLFNSTAPEVIERLNENALYQTKELVESLMLQPQGVSS